MQNEIDLWRLVKKQIVCENAYQHMDALLDYFNNKPVKMSNPIARLNFAKYISDPDRYDQIFDRTGEFIDLNEITDDPNVAEHIFKTLDKKDQEEFVSAFRNQKIQDPILEPSYKIMTVKKQYPDTTLMVRFVGDNQMSNVQKKGFTIGTKDMDRLHATEYYGKEHKAGGGYIYAYLADSDEARKQAKAVEVGQSYGENCVFFKYPGLLVYHKLDGEDQVIVYGPDIIPENSIFAKGVGDNQFVILNAGFDKSPKSYDQILKLIKNI